jgi:hypothetical protein
MNPILPDFVVNWHLIRSKSNKKEILIPKYFEKKSCLIIQQDNDSNLYFIEFK